LFDVMMRTVSSPRDGAGDFRKFGSVHGGSKRLRAARRRFKNEKIFRRSHVEKEFAQGASEGRKWRRFFAESCGLFVAFGGLDQPQFLKIAGKRGLGDTETLLRETAAQVVLAGMRSPETRRRIWP